MSEQINTIEANKLFESGNDLFMNDKYTEALELYNEAIEKCDQTNKQLYYNIYIARSQTYLKLSEPSKALQDAQYALELNTNNNNSKAYLRKGMAYFGLKDYNNALESFQVGQAKVENDTIIFNLFDEWIEKCKKELKLTLNGIEKEKIVKNKNTKYDWYQTESHITICLLVKGMKQDDLSVEIDHATINIESSSPSAENFTLKLALLHEIESSNFTIKCLSTKIEIKAKKKENIQWSSLEVQNKDKIDSKPVIGHNDDVKKYPTSSKQQKDWDKLVSNVVKEEKDEKLEGDAALNKLFQQIYADASDEVKRAMNKSFTESGGTVLSTNWNEVGNKKVECKPPDGLEWKKWN